MAGERRQRDCEGFLALVDEYVDGELEPRQRARVDGHLKLCHSCRSELGLARAARELLRGAERLEPSRAFVARVGHRIADEQRRLDRRRRMFRFLVPAMVPTLVALLVLVLPYLRSTSPDGSTGPPSDVVDGGRLASRPAPLDAAPVDDGPGMEIANVAEPAQDTDTPPTAARAPHTQVRVASATGSSASAKVTPPPTLDVIVESTSSLAQPWLTRERSPSYVTPRMAAAGTDVAARPVLVASVPDFGAVYGSTVSLATSVTHEL